MKYKHTETNEQWDSSKTSTSRTSNFYLLSHAEKVELGWELVPEPVITQPQRTLDELKQDKKNNMRYLATEKITAQYPAYKQTNAALGIYGEQFKTDMISFIQNVRARVEELDILIDAVTQESELQNIVFEEVQQEEIQQEESDE